MNEKNDFEARISALEAQGPSEFHHATLQALDAFHRRLAALEKIAESRLRRIITLETQVEKLKVVAAAQQDALEKKHALDQKAARTPAAM